MVKTEAKTMDRNKPAGNKLADIKPAGSKATDIKPAGKASRRIIVSPLTRSSGQLTVQTAVQQGRIVEAWVIGGVYRGYESILTGRPLTDAVWITQRICGICSAAHGLVSSQLLDQIYGLTVTANGKLLRNLILGAEFLQNLLRHFYFLGLPDFVTGLPVSPSESPKGLDYRFSPKQTRRLLEHWQESIAASRKCHELATLLAGKMPHPHGLVPGGATVNPKTDVLNKFAATLAGVRQFIEARLLPDTRMLAETYADYYQLGLGPGNFLSYGAFPDADSAGQLTWKAGAVIQGERQSLDLRLITETHDFSWFKKDQPAEGPEDLLAQPEEPAANKLGAYTWVETPRYGGVAVEVGPLARAVVGGEPLRSSTMDRIMARSLETAQIGELMAQWLGRFEPGQPAYQPPESPVIAEGWGVSEAPRGSLLHALKVELEGESGGKPEVEGDRIKSYKIITPSEWNFSPRDAMGQRGAVEQALIGIPVQDVNNPIEVGRVVRSFDPCLYCATHLLEL